MLHFPLQTSHVELYCRMGFQFVLESTSRVGILGMVFSLIQKNKQNQKNTEIYFTFPRSVEWIMFLPFPVCVQRE